MEETPTGEVVVRFKRATVLKAAGLLLSGVALTMTCAAIAIAKTGLVVMVIGWFGFVFFGFCMLVAVRLFFSRSSGVMVDRYGIIDRTNYLSVGRIPWEDIRGMRLAEMMGQEFIVVDVRNPQQYARHGNRLQRWLKAMNTPFVGSPVVLGLAPLDVSGQDLLDTLTRFFERAMLSRRPAGLIAHQQARRISYKPTRAVE